MAILKVFGYDDTTGKPALKDDAEVQAYILPAPASRTSSAGNAFVEIGSVVYVFARYDPKSIKNYTFWLDHATASTEVEVRRESDGALLGSTIVGVTGLHVIVLAANIPIADDALFVEFRKSGAGAGGTIVAADFIFDA